MLDNPRKWLFCSYWCPGSTCQHHLHPHVDRMQPWLIHLPSVLLVIPSPLPTVSRSELSDHTLPPWLVRTQRGMDINCSCVRVRYAKAWEQWHRQWGQHRHSRAGNPPELSHHCSRTLHVSPCTCVVLLNGWHVLSPLRTTKSAVLSYFRSVSSKVKKLSYPIFYATVSFNMQIKSNIQIVKIQFLELILVRFFSKCRIAFFLWNRESSRS
jgi:hypothetical protein